MRRVLASASVLLIALTFGLVQPSSADPQHGPSLTATPSRALTDGQQVRVAALGFFSFVSHDATFTPSAYECPAGLFPQSAVDPLDRADEDLAALVQNCARVGDFPVTGDYSQPESPTFVTVAARATVATAAGGVLHCGQVPNQCVLLAAGATQVDDDDPGLGLASTPITFATATPRTRPGAPRSVSVVAGNGEVAVSWKPPASDGGSPIIGYKVTPSIGVAQPSQTIFSTATTHTITGLTNGTTYRFTVTAINPVGPGPQSALSDPVVPAGPPGAPTIGTATAGHHEITLTWTAPASNGGSPITAYLVTPYVGPIAQPAHRFGSPGTKQTVTGLTSGTAYTFKVAAVNDVGTGPQSQASHPVAPK